MNFIEKINCFKILRKSRYISFMFILLLAGCASYSPMPLNKENLNKAFSLDNIKKDPALYYKVAFHKPLNLDELAKVAVLNNKALKTYRDSAGIANAQILKARTIPNPNMSLDAARPFMGNIAGAYDPYDIIPSFNISFLFSRNANIKSATLQAEATRLEIAYKEWQTAEQTKLDAVKLLFLQDAVKNYNEKLYSYKKSYMLIKLLYNKGLSTVTALNMARANLQKAEFSFININKNIKGLKANLKTLLGLPLSYKLNISNIKFKIKVPSETILNKDIKSRLDLEAFKIAYKAQEERLIASILSQFPKMSISTPFSSDNANIQTIGLGINISIPLFDRNQAGIAKETATRKQMFDDYINRLQTARSDINVILYDINAIKRQITLTDKQIKNLESVLKLYKKKFKQREIGVFELYAVKNNLLNERIKLLTLRENFYNSIVSLEIASGTTIIKSK
ncbi:MAG: TolC family protein [bacterium]